MEEIKVSLQATGWWWRMFAAGSLAVTTLYGVTLQAQTGNLTGQQMIKAMIGQEQNASRDHAHYSYLSEERSERTKGHLWTERMVETDWGTVRYLIAIDGSPLSKDQVSSEKARLAEDTVDPERYKRREQDDDDSQQYKQMLAVLSKAFLFEVLSENTKVIRIGYRPDPAFLPETTEERALHGMVGLVLLDAKTLRLHRLEGRAPKDVSLGFGPFANLRAGSSFATDREQMQESVWRTSSVKTSIQGKALLLKTIARQQEYRHNEFQCAPANLTLQSAVAFLER